MGRASSYSPPNGNSFSTFRHRDALRRAQESIHRHIYRRIYGQVKLDETDLVIVVMGSHGTGKSSFISTMTGNNYGIGHDLQPATVDIKHTKFQCLSRIDSGILFIDTPGFDDTDLAEEKALKKIKDYLVRIYPRLPLLRILYLHNITHNRVGVKSVRNIRRFKELCGENEDALHRLCFVTTMWDEVNGTEGLDREAELKADLWKTMIKQGCGIRRYDGTSLSAWGVIEDLVQGANNQFGALLECDMSDIKALLGKTEEGQALYTDLRSLVDKQREILKRTREIIKQAGARDRDVQCENLRAEYEDSRLKLVKVVGVIQAIKIPLGKYLLRAASTSIDMEPRTK